MPNPDLPNDIFDAQPPSGFQYEWIRDWRSTRGAARDRLKDQVISKRVGGWVPVPASRHPELTKEQDYVRGLGMVLMERIDAQS